MRVIDLFKLTKKKYRIHYNTTKITEIINFFMNKKLVSIVRFGLNNKGFNNSMTI